MEDFEYLEKLIEECKTKENRRFASSHSAIEFDRLLDEIRYIVIRNKDNKQIVLTAALYDASVIEYASDELKKDPEIVLCAVQSGINYVNLGLDEKVVQVVKETLLNNKQETEQVFYGLDGTKFYTSEEAILYNESLMNDRSR